MISVTGRFLTPQNVWITDSRKDGLLQGPEVIGQEGMALNQRRAGLD